MACWIYLEDKSKNIKSKLQRFKKVFDLSDGFDLNIKVIELSEQKHFIIWSWNNLGDFPDISYHVFKHGTLHILIDGFISDFGKYGDTTTSTEETALKLYNLIQRGEVFETALNGSFCLLIYDSEKDQLKVINDRLSSRSVWYSRELSNMYISNLPSAIATIKEQALEIDRVGLWSFLATSRHIGEKGIFKNIINLRPATSFNISQDRTVTQNTWNTLAYTPNRELTPEEWGERIASELVGSAKKIKEHYKAINLFLSGGMDSRVAAAAFGGDTNSLTLTTRDNMNSKISAKVSRYCEMNHETVYRDSYWYLAHFKEAALISSGNYKITHAHFTSVFSRDAKFFNHAFTHGDLLENFNKHYFKNVSRRLEYNEFFDNFNKIYSYSVKDFDRYELLFHRDYGKKIREEWKAYAVNQLKRVDSYAEEYQDVYDAYFRWQNTSVCPTYLMLENLRPFASLVNLMFDNQLLLTLLSIPHEIKSKGILHNEILRNLNPKLLKLPNSNFWLPPGTPALFTNTAKKIRPIIGKYRRKLKNRNPDKPFVHTEGSWDMLHERYRKDDRHKELISQTIKNHDFIERFHLNKKYIDAIYDKFMNGDLSKTIEIDMLFSLGMLIKQIE